MAQKKKNKKSAYRLELEAEVKPMMMKANMMLTNLEQLAKEEEFAGVEKFAYRKALAEIKAIRGEEYKRFNMPKNTHQLERTERALREFLKSPTASKSAILEMYEKNAASLNDKIGSKFSWQKMGTFLKAAEFEEMKEKFDSATAIIAMKQIYKHRRKSGKKKFIAMLEKHEISELDEVDSDVLADFIKTNIKWTDLR